MPDRDLVYVVEGTWPFPLAAMREEGSHSATAADRETVRRLSRSVLELLAEGGSPAEFGDACFRRHRVRLVIPNAARSHRPVVTRWERRRWSVMEAPGVHLVPFHPVQRVAPGPDPVETALAKLTSVEAQAVTDHFLRLGAPRDGR